MPKGKSFGEFEDSDGNRFPVYDDYRYAVKPGWRWAESLDNVSFVKNSRKLPDEILERFNQLIGTRTITASLDDIRDFALPILREHEDLFVEGTLNDLGEAVPRIPASHYENMVVQLTNAARERIGAHLPDLAGKSQRILDVGCGFGLSTLAYRRLGHRVTGLDNNYGSDRNYSQVTRVRSMVSANADAGVEFVTGDVTECPALPDCSFDMIVSISCLEHIQDLDKAFSEMHRLLRPGGWMLHSLNHFWSENGAHALGILDAPWLHAALSEKDYERYIREFRSHEADAALSWNSNALNRSITIRSLQRSLADAGFSIQSWSESIGDSARAGMLDRKILSHVNRHYPDVSLADLLAKDITFSAQK
ncbi:methyltransferase family protein [Aestuariispira insulae]|uniref:Methyltransferase family protein n=1 Tax=Aestuariispira insulae TaxID=1461337 RepID=A0A3D9H457_9PROT|nr:methyltransferase family protein [Aestuariispira insulae]